MNKEWHAKNVMPRNASRAQRVKWHAVHARQCACRKPPDSLREEVEKLVGAKARVATKK